ncbi:MAG: DUF2892 domain-containing protein, partial [Acidobacteriota bacterium]|nr:DUF2892 domain-containing protein [Acidobacteriota bacterium]
MKTLPFEIDRYAPILDPSRLTSDRANISDNERWGSAAVGTALLAYGLKRRDWTGALSAILGAGMLYRGATGHCQVSESIGRDTRSGDTRDALAGPRGVHVCESVILNRPIADVYNEWRNLESLPDRMQHIEEVQELSDGTSHWVARGPAGALFEWDAEILQDIPSQLIS